MQSVTLGRRLTQITLVSKAHVAWPCFSGEEGAHVALSQWEEGTHVALFQWEEGTHVALFQGEEGAHVALFQGEEGAHVALSQWKEGTDTEQALRSGSPRLSTVISK